MNTQQSSVAEVFRNAKDKAQRREWDRELSELTRLIYKLSGEMGSWDFVTAMRERGYDIDADTGTVERHHGVNIN